MSIYHLFSIWFVLLGSIRTESPLHFELHFSDRSGDNNLDYDCLNYHVRDDIVHYDEQNIVTIQTIPYCIRSNDENDVPYDSTNRGTAFTFQELSMQAVTSEQMLTWPSVSIDLIERYQAYLNNPSVSSGSQIFYNCSSSYFGDFCQYTFDSNHNFSDIVRMTFLEKSQINDSLEAATHTCYVHLPCDRGPAPSCLDYREVCDGKIDCKDGQDEEFCFELETNKCKKNEYQCHNGLCIPDSFFQDDRLNPECSDRSDEFPITHNKHYSHSCSQDPAFRCEETTCLDSKYITCGDGQCNDFRMCNNRRDLFLNQTIFSLSNNDDFSILCWYAMLCVTENNHLFGNDDICSFCNNSNDTDCATVIRRNCPSIFKFPSTSILFSHVYFIYDNTNNHVNEIWMPEFVCYNDSLCDFLPATLLINGMTCRRFHGLNFPTSFRNWHEMLTAVRDLFSTCSLRVESKVCDDTASLFQCGSNSSKCISQRRLVDGVIDCPDGSDETFKFSCALSDSHHRFRCSTENTCIAPFLVQDGIRHCMDGTDEDHSATKEVEFDTSTSSLSHRPVWLCNRGILVYTGEKRKEKCLCPPSYYGERCQYQNQRVSVTMKVRSSELHSSFALILTLIDEENQINSHEQITYQPNYHCNRKFNLYLLFSSRPKFTNKNYSVRIDAFEKSTLEYRASWSYPILFPFLPVYRLAIDITIPASRSEVQFDSCPLVCQHGRCARFENAPQDSFCQCDVGWFGPRCTLRSECNCSPDSLCLGSVHNRSLCLCPLSKFSPRCLLTQSVCQIDTCKNGGQCISINAVNFTCICQNGYHGSRCEKTSTHVTLFVPKDMNMMQPLFVHFITVMQDSEPYRTTFIKKNICDQKSISFLMEHPIHLVFTEFFNRYYLNLIQLINTPITQLSINVSLSHRCASIDELFNSSIVSLPVLHRIKYYNIPCQEQVQISCFVDEIHMCLCDQNRYANCFNFDHNVTYDCKNANNCQRMVRCLDDDHVSCSATFTARMMSLWSIVYQTILCFLMFRF